MSVKNKIEKAFLKHTSRLEVSKTYVGSTITLIDADALKKDLIKIIKKQLKKERSWKKLKE